MMKKRLLSRKRSQAAVREAKKYIKIWLLKSCFNIFQRTSSFLLSILRVKICDKIAKEKLKVQYVTSGA